ncbi:MAG: acyl carrier protein [Methylocystaceae bacterium]
MSVFETVKAIIVEILDINPDEVTMEAHFTNDLDASSLDVVEMLMLLEEKYELQIPEDTAEAMKTVKDVVVFLEQRLTA